MVGLLFFWELQEITEKNSASTEKSDECRVYSASDPSGPPEPLGERIVPFLLS